MRRFEIGFAALLVLTIAAKFAARQPPSGTDRALFAATVAGILTDRAYVIRMHELPSGIVVEARRDRCRMTVREYPPEGTFAASIAHRARAVGALSFAYRGELHAKAPKIRPLAELYMRRVMHRLGLTPQRTPIVAIAASPGCDIAALPWERLATLPR